LANTLEQLLTLLILVIGAWMVMGNDGFTIGMLVAFQMFAARLAQPMLRLVGLWQEFQQAAIAVKRLGDVMNAPAEPYSVLPARSSADLVEIELSDLSFRYAENLPYLYQRLNLRIRPGATIALMGPSGSGKSTLAKLLQGFYLPTDGQVRLSGRDARNLAANELRAYFGVVPQETVLFSGSIYDNLILANPHASFQQVVKACRMAEIHDVIERLPDGYQTTIGEHGVGAVRRTAPTPRDREGTPEEAARPDFRRGDIEPGWRDGRAVRAHGEPAARPGHHAFHRSPAAAGAAGGRDRAARTDRRAGGAARRPAGRGVRR
jgi:ATP-binding cassette, subfamily B, bacterial HlyB/CyaB